MFRMKFKMEPQHSTLKINTSVNEIIHLDSSDDEVDIKNEQKDKIQHNTNFLTMGKNNDDNMQESKRIEKLWNEFGITFEDDNKYGINDDTKYENGPQITSAQIPVIDRILKRFSAVQSAEKSEPIRKLSVSSPILNKRLLTTKVTSQTVEDIIILEDSDDDATSGDVTDKPIADRNDYSDESSKVFNCDSSNDSKYTKKEFKMKMPKRRKLYKKSHIRFLIKKSRKRRRIYKDKQIFIGIKRNRNILFRIRQRRNYVSSLKSQIKRFYTKPTLCKSKHLLDNINLFTKSLKRNSKVLEVIVDAKASADGASNTETVTIEKNETSSNATTDDIRTNILNQIKLLRNKPLLSEDNAVPKTTSGSQSSVQPVPVSLETSASCELELPPSSFTDYNFEDEKPSCSWIYNSPERKTHNTPEISAPDNNINIKQTSNNIKINSNKLKSYDITKFKSLKYKKLLQEKQNIEAFRVKNNEDNTSLMHDNKLCEIQIVAIEILADPPKNVDTIMNKIQHAIEVNENNIKENIAPEIENKENVLEEELKIKAVFASDKLDMYMKGLGREFNDKDLLITKTNIVRPNCVPQKHPEAVVPVKKAFIKPKTLAEKRILMRKEMEGEIREKMLQNEQLIERQLKRQSVNNKRTETSVVRDTVLNDVSPVNRKCWKNLIKLQSDTKYIKQYVQWRDMRIKVVGSTGGDNKMLYLREPKVPSIAPLIIRRKSTTILNKIQKPILFNNNVPNFKPGPLSKKHQLENERSGDIIYGAKMPTICIEVFPRVGRMLDETAKKYLNLARENADEIEENWARFATSVLVTNDVSISEESFTFELPYKNNQTKILMKQLNINNNTNECEEKQRTDESIIQEMISNMFDSVEHSLVGDSIICEDKDTVVVEDSNKNIHQLSAVQQDIKIKNKKESSKPNRQNMELKRLDITIINLEEERSGSESCGKPYCTLGCVCNSLLCNKPLKDHCQKADCIFQCTCENHEQFKNINNCDDFNRRVNELKDENEKHLAKVEREFRHTVVITKQNTIIVGESSKDKKRIVKVPKRFKDFIPADEQVSLYKKIETDKRNVSLADDDVDMVDISKSMKPPIISDLKTEPEFVIPKIVKTESLCQSEVIQPEYFIDNKLNIAPKIYLHKLRLENVEPWCMVHSLYKCFCKCRDTNGETFQLRKTNINKIKRKATDDVENDERKVKRKKSEPKATKVIKTLNRHIICESDEESNDSDDDKWCGHEYRCKCEGIVKIERKVDRSKIGKQETVTRQLSRIDNLQNNAEHKQFLKIKPEKELLQESFWNANDSYDEQDSPKVKSSSLLDEFAMSTKKVIHRNKSDKAKDKNKQAGNETIVDILTRSPPPKTCPKRLEDSIKKQRELYYSMRSARTSFCNIASIKKITDRNKLKSVSLNKGILKIEKDHPEFLQRLKQIIIDSTKSPSIYKLNKGKELVNVKVYSKINKNVEDEVNKKISNGKRLSNLQSIVQTNVQSTSSAETCTLESILKVNTTSTDFLNKSPVENEHNFISWYTLLKKFLNNEIFLWFEPHPQRVKAMALLTVRDIPPNERCINVKHMNNRKPKPLFITKLYKDTKDINLLNTEKPVVFLRGRETYWLIEGISVSEDTAISLVKNSLKNEIPTDNMKSELGKLQLTQQNNKIRLSADAGTVNKFKDNLIKPINQLNRNKINILPITETVDLIESDNESCVTKEKDLLVESSVQNFKNSFVSVAINNSERYLDNDKLVLSTKTRKSLHSFEDAKLNDNISHPSSSTIDKSNNLLYVKGCSLKPNKHSLYNYSYPGKNGLLYAPLPFINKSARWLMISLYPKFSVLSIAKYNCQVKYSRIMQGINCANNKKLRVRIPASEDTVQDRVFGIYVIPTIMRHVFLGPYEKNEPAGVTKYVTWNNGIVSEEDLNRVHNKAKPNQIGTWLHCDGETKTSGDTEIIHAQVVKRIDLLDNEQEQYNEIETTIPDIDSINDDLSKSNYEMKDKLSHRTIKTIQNGKGIANRGILSINPDGLIKKKKLADGTICSRSLLKPTVVSNMLRDSRIRNNSFINDNSKGLKPNENKIVRKPRVYSSQSIYTKKRNLTNVKINAITSNNSVTLKDQNSAPSLSVNNKGISTEETESQSLNSPKETDNITVKSSALIEGLLNNNSSDSDDVQITNKPPEIICISDSEEEQDKEENATSFARNEPKLENKNMNSEKKGEEDIDHFIDYNKKIAWITSNIPAIGYLVAKLKPNKMICFNLPVIPRPVEFNNMNAVNNWMNKLFSKLVYVIPQNFVIKWTLHTTPRNVTSMKPFLDDLFLGHYIAHPSGLIDMLKSEAPFKQLTIEENQLANKHILIYYLKKLAKILDLAKRFQDIPEKEQNFLFIMKKTQLMISKLQSDSKMQCNEERKQKRIHADLKNKLYSLRSTETEDFVSMEIDGTNTYTEETVILSDED